MREPARPKERQRAERSRSRSDRLLGWHSVREALAAGRRDFGALLLRRGADSPEVTRIVEAARRVGVPIREVDADELARGLGPHDRTPLVGLEAGSLPELSLAELCAGGAGARRLVALDGVEDPQNLGAIARVADAAGACGLVLQKRRGAPLSSAVSRASAGAIEWLPVARVANLPRALQRLKADGFWIVGADLGGESIFELPDRLLQGDLAVVLGGEGKGLRPVVRALVDHPVRIPMQGRVESLNVATASAVILFDLLRRAASPSDDPRTPRG